MSFKVQYKVLRATETWHNHGSYGSETSALSNAERIAVKYVMVRVVDSDGNVIWSH